MKVEIDDTRAFKLKFPYWYDLKTCSNLAGIILFELLQYGSSIESEICQDAGCYQYSTIACIDQAHPSFAEELGSLHLCCQAYQNI